ncbi:MAG TPA: hypothetical protein VFV86_08310 [Nitrososphaeraceae archaeon]|nr:hypothetical protein [Nitrososphaeraceae archaeon]
MSSKVNDNNSDTNKILSGFTNNILHSHTSMSRGIIDANGITICEQYRKCLNLLLLLLLTEEEKLMNLQRLH